MTQLSELVQLDMDVNWVYAQLDMDFRSVHGKARELKRKQDYTKRNQLTVDGMVGPRRCQIMLLA